MSTTAEEEKYPPRTTDEVANLDLTFITDAWGADMLRDAMNAVVLTQLDPEISKNKIAPQIYPLTPIILIFRDSIQIKKAK